MWASMEGGYHVCVYMSLLQLSVATNEGTCFGMIYLEHTKMTCNNTLICKCFHDEQHGIAFTLLAALMNASKTQGKSIMILICYKCNCRWCRSGGFDMFKL